MDAEKEFRVKVEGGVVQVSPVRTWQYLIASSSLSLEPGLADAFNFRQSTDGSEFFCFHQHGYKHFVTWAEVCQKDSVVLIRSFVPKFAVNCLDGVLYVHLNGATYRSTPVTGTYFMLLAGGKMTSDAFIQELEKASGK